MRAVIYCRISEDRTGLAAGVARQEADARALCTRRGFEVVDVVIDNDVKASRYSSKPRPGYRRVLELVAAGEVEVIAAYHVDRLYRRPAELEELIDLAESTLIATCEGEFRLDTSDGRAMARVVSAMAAKSSDDASRRIKRKHLEMAENGLPAGSPRRPFGFDDDRVTLRLDEVDRIREATARLLGGDSLSAICRDWNAAGLLTPSKAQWRTSALRRMLTAPRMTGLRALRGEVVGDAVWQPILDRDTWNALRLTLSSRAPTMAEGFAARTYLLAGLVRCKPCDVRMASFPLWANGKRYPRYFCRTVDGGCNRVGISATRLEETVLGAMVRNIRASGKLSVPRRLEATDDLAASMARAEADLRELASQLADQMLGPAAYAAASVAVERRLDSLRRQAARAPGNADLAALQASMDPDVLLASFSFDRRRAVCLAMIERITIAPATSRGIGFDSERAAITWTGD